MHIRKGITTNDNGLKKNLVTAYVDRADAMDNSDYENKIAAYGDALDLDSTNESALSGRKACAYAVLDDMMDAQQYDRGRILYQYICGQHVGCGLLFLYRED